MTLTHGSQLTGKQGLARALGEAFKRRRTAQNPAELAKPPRVEEEEVEPFEAEEIHRLLRTALAKRNGVRFVVALALGIRQGEALGLRWSRLDGESRTFQIRKAIQRRTWQHGCANPHACRAKYQAAANLTREPSRRPISG